MKPDYGIDAPVVIRNLFIAAFLLLVAALLTPPVFISFTHGRLTLNLMFEVTVIVLFVQANLMQLYSKWGKFRHRDRMLNMYQWQGNENVLDIGTGHGLLMIGAAKRLLTGKSVGIDIWNVGDLSNNTLEQAKNNAALEQVSDRIEIISENIVKTSFAGGSFDVILSNLCLHNIDEKAKRDEACKEICRILKPGGTAIISDFKNISQYKRIFEQEGLTLEIRHTYYLDTFPPLTIIKARKG